MALRAVLLALVLTLPSAAFAGKAHLTFDFDLIETNSSKLVEPTGILSIDVEIEQDLALVFKEAMKDADAKLKAVFAPHRERIGGFVSAFDEDVAAVKPRGEKEIRAW